MATGSTREVRTVGFVLAVCAALLAFAAPADSRSRKRFSVKSVSTSASANAGQTVDVAVNAKTKGLRIRRSTIILSLDGVPATAVSLPGGAHRANSRFSVSGALTISADVTGGDHKIFACPAPRGGCAFATLSVPPARLTINPTSKDFGSVPTGNTTPPESFLVTNVGGAKASPVEGITGDHYAGFNYGGGNCYPPTVLLPGATCVAQVTFYAQHMGPDSGFVTIFNGGVPMVSAALTGTGT